MVVVAVKTPSVPLSKPSLSSWLAPQPRGVAVAVGEAVRVGDTVAEGVTGGRGVLLGRGVLVIVAVGGVPVTVGVGVPPNGPAGSGQTKAPRLRVNAASVVKPRSIWKSQTIVLGMPAAKRNHCGVGASILFV